MGLIYYRLPSGEGWCLSDRSEDTEFEIHYLISFCLFTFDPSVSIQVIRFKRDATSIAAALEDYAQGYEGIGFQIQSLNFLGRESPDPRRRVSYASLRMTHPEYSDPLLLHLASFEAGGDNYLVEGGLVEQYSQRAWSFLEEATDEIIVSISD